MFIVGMLSSPAEWVVVLIIVLIFFGVGKLPKVMGQMGKGVKAFKEGMNETDSEKAQKAIDVTPSDEVEASTEAAEVADEVAEG
jgi:sec-independent protein translocase protein TatA